MHTPMADTPHGPVLSQLRFPLPHRWVEGATAFLDPEGRTLQVNQAFKAWWGEWDGPPLPGDYWVFLQARAAGYHEMFERLRANADTFAQLTFQFSCEEETSDSPWFNMELARHEGGTVVRIHSALPPLAKLEESAFDDVLRSEPARREMFVRLLRVEAQLEGLMHRWPCVIFSQRPDFSFEYVSPQMESLAGISPAACSENPRRFWQLVHEADAGELQQQIARSVSASANLTTTYRIRHTLTGRIIYILEQRQPLLSRNGLLLGYDVAWMNVTRQTIAEKRLCTAAWKETLAVLTLGMAHDFSNIMAGIHSLSESFLTQVEASHSFHEGLSLIKSNSLQAGQLVHRMIHLHRGQTGERAYLDLNTLVMEVVELLRKILPRRIQIAAELSPEALAIYADVVEFRQVVINLTLNAADAMPHGGLISLRSSVHPELPPVAHYTGVLPKTPAVCLAIEDCGMGIERRHLSAVFDPFFTTKTQSGSGLGLYNARLFVEKHHGAISVKSVEGKGASFCIWLPQADFSESEREPAANTVPVLRHTLLLHGQPGSVRGAMTEHLRSQGFHVVEAHSPEAAGDYLSAPDYEFSAVLVLVEPNETVLSALMEELDKPRAREFKRVVQLVGLDQDALEARTLNRFDLVLSSELSPREQLCRLKALLNPRSNT
jgi:signal transduction histidine kinase